MPRRLLPGAALAGFGAAALAAQPPVMPGVPDAAQARIDYMLKCQGCHQPDGAGNATNSPPLKDAVGRFLALPEGRVYLGRVPGIATTNLDDARLAQLLNWTLYRFDAAHLPQGFRPYSAAEIGTLRQRPLRLDHAAVRARLVRAIAAKS